MNLPPLLASRTIETVAWVSWWEEVSRRNETPCPGDDEEELSRSCTKLVSKAGTALSLLNSEHTWVDRHLLSQSAAHIELTKAIALKCTALIGPSRKQAKLTFKNESKQRAERRCIG